MGKEYEPSDRKIAFIKKTLKDDIFWTVKYGPGWDPLVGAIKNGKWHAHGRCHNGVCAIGAYCVRRQPHIVPSVLSKIAKVDLHIDVAAAAIEFGVPYRWLYVIYYGVNDIASVPSTFPRAKALARTLRKFGDATTRNKEELRDEAAREDQQFAERHLMR